MFLNNFDTAGVSGITELVAHFALLFEKISDSRLLLMTHRVYYIEVSKQAPEGHVMFNDTRIKRIIT